jgi:hypothetical protein
MSQYQSYTTSSFLKSIHPNQNVFPFTLASFPQQLRNKLDSGSVAIGVGFSEDNNFIGETLINTNESNFVSPSSPSIEKIRIIDQQVQGDFLSPFIRTEKTSPFDFSVDTNQLNIVFSQTNQINRDIISQYGDKFSIDNNAGDPLDQYKDSYKDLNSLKKKYFQKYKGKNDLNAFIKLSENFDNSILNITEKVIPGRTNTTMGVSIEPTILEKNKLQLIDPTFTDFSLEGNLSQKIEIKTEDKSLDTFLYVTRIAESSFNNFYNQLFLPLTQEETDISSITENSLLYSPYDRTSNIDFSTNPSITNPFYKSSLIYIFDSLIQYNIPSINLSPINVGRTVGINFITTNDTLLSSSQQLLISERDVNSIRYKAGPKALTGEESGINVRHVITSSKFEIPDGAEVTISGSFSQPNMGNRFGGIPELGTSVIIDDCSSTSGWTVQNPLNVYATLSVQSSSFLFPSSSNSDYLRLQISDYAYYGGVLSSPFYPINSSGQHQISFFVVSAQGDPRSLDPANLLVEVRQNNQTRSSIKIPFTSINYISGITGIKQTINFGSISGSFQLRFIHTGISSPTLDYRIDSIATASFSTSSYDAPYVQIRMVSGSYINTTGSFSGTEIISTGQIKAPIPDKFRQDIYTARRISGSKSDVFLEIEFFISSITGSRSLLEAYNQNPISINNLLIDTGTTLEKQAFRIEKIININEENLDSSEVINKDDPDFISFLSNELVPSFNFSITNFGDNPNRLDRTYNIFTSSLGINRGQVELGNLTGRNFIPIDLKFGPNETDDLQNFYNFNEKGIILPTNVTDSFKNQKQNIINFVKREIES